MQFCIYRICVEAKINEILEARINELEQKIKEINK